jgi:hypothetical protein
MATAKGRGNAHGNVATPAQRAAKAEQRRQRQIAEHAGKLARLLGLDADEVMRRIAKSE